MRAYGDMNPQELAEEKARQEETYHDLCSRGLTLDMSRGKPSAAQLDLSNPMLSIISSGADCFDETGLDCRNYGVLDGIAQAKELMASLLDDEAANVIVFGNSSLTVMYDTIVRCMDFGCLGYTPWGELDTVRFICPTPGYDRHFAILEQLGIDMIPVRILDDGPDMDEVEKLVWEDETIKGIWCVPKYANPSGVVYSDEVVRRLAAMPSKAKDFRIFWDNAYCVHDLYPSTRAHLLDIAQACREAGTENRYFKFASTSKITFPGAGIAALAAAPEVIAETKQLISAQMISADKLNQLRHVRFLPDIDAVRAHMDKHAAIIRPKFELVERRLDEELGDLGIAQWTHPNGGYFISFDGLPGTAKRTVALSREAGVTLTSAGATWPYGEDPADANIRIAPTMPPLEELEAALDVFVCAAKLAALEALER